MTPETKKQIDSMTVEQLLRDQRFAPIGSTKFQGEEGEYRGKRLAELRKQDNGAYVAASKSIGW